MSTNLSPVSWEAEEYITKSHNTWWYVGLGVIAIALSALAIFLQGWTFLALIIVSVITILIFSLRPPRTIKYHISSKGIKEGNTFHAFSDYRAFGILKEDEHYSAILIPKKRFGLSTKVYFPETSGESIVDHLGAHLPMEDVSQDLLDKIVSILRI